MARSGYFDTEEKDGFLLRTHYAVEKDVITITALQAKTSYYAGTRYPDGEITVNGKTVLSMVYGNPTTHVFNLQTLDVFVDIFAASNGVPLPVSSEKVNGKAEIKIDVVMGSSNSNVPQPRLTGSVMVNLDSAVPMVHSAGAFSRRQAAAKISGSGKEIRCVYHDGSGWKT